MFGIGQHVSFKIVYFNIQLSISHGTKGLSKLGEHRQSVNPHDKIHGFFFFFFWSIGGGPVRNQHPPNNTCNLGRSPRRVSQQPIPLTHYRGIAGPSLNARLISRSLVHEPTHSGSLKPAGQSSHNYISSMCPCVPSWGSNSGWGVPNLASVPTQP